jgi:hypothetical protein
MHYFKNESDAKNVSAALGGVSLETVDWVRPYDSTPGMYNCLVFVMYAMLYDIIYLFILCDIMYDMSYHVM